MDTYKRAISDHKRSRYGIKKILVFSAVFLFALSAGAANRVGAATPVAPAQFHGAAFSGSRQVITVTSNGMNTRSAVFNCYQKQGTSWVKIISGVSALIGKNGMEYDSKRVQDTDTTPAGVYNIVYAFGWAKNPGTKLSYRVTDSNSYWDENSGSKTYNRWVEGCPGGEYEQLKTQPLYKYALVLDFNWAQKPKKGAGIFIHLKPNLYTGGCVGITESNLVKVMQWADPSQKTKVLICPQSDFSSYYYSDGMPAILSCIDYPKAGSKCGGNVSVSGWAVSSAGLNRVDVYMDKKGIASVRKFTSRPDVQSTINSNGDYVVENNGYTLTIPQKSVSKGKHELEIAAIGKDGLVNWQTRTFVA